MHVHAHYVLFSCVCPLRDLCKHQTGLYVRELIPAEQRRSYKMSNRILFSRFLPTTLALSLTLSLFDLHELDIYSKQVYPRCMFVCVCVCVCVWGYTACSSCVFTLYKRAWPIHRELIIHEASQRRGRGRSPWKPGGDWLHVDMLMYSGRVHVVGQWVYKPVTGHHWKTTLLTTIWYAVCIVPLWMLKWLIGCTLTHRAYAFRLVDGSGGCRSSA